MGVWVRGLVLALGLLAGCETIEFIPEKDQDYIEISYSSTMMGSLQPTEWRVYDDDVVYSYTSLGRQTIVRDRYELGLFERALRVLNQDQIDELVELQEQYAYYCRPRPVPSFMSDNPMSRCGLVADTTILSIEISYLDDKYTFRYEGEPIDGVDFGSSLIQVFEELKKILR